MSQRRYENTDFEWSIIEPLLANKPREVPRGDDRMVPNGIYRHLRTGSPWVDTPERYGPPTTCSNRFVRWCRSGVGSRIFEAVTAAYGGDLQMIDSSSIPRSPARGERKNGGRRPPPGTSLTPDAWGARGVGLTTKIHALVDANGLPVALKLTPDQPMTAGVLRTCSTTSARARSCSPTERPIPMQCAKPWTTAAPGPASRPCRTGIGRGCSLLPAPPRPPGARHHGCRTPANEPSPRTSVPSDRHCFSISRCSH